jgi:glycerophosphoryl diester phosphodiesterase
MSEVNETVEIHISHDLPLTPEELAKRQADRITKLEEQLAAQLQKGRNRLVQTDDGERSVDELAAEAKAYRIHQATEAIRVQQAADARAEQLKQTRWRPDGSVAWAPDQESLAPVHSTMESVAKEVGLRCHRWTTAQKAAAVTTRQSAVDNLPIEKYWGKTGSAVAAAELIEKNPLLYALGKKRALRENKF